jgi:hypothetical protein
LYVKAAVGGVEQKAVDCIIACASLLQLWLSSAPAHLQQFHVEPHAQATVLLHVEHFLVATLGLPRAGDNLCIQHQAPIAKENAFNLRKASRGKLQNEIPFK